MRVAGVDQFTNSFKRASDSVRDLQQTAGKIQNVGNKISGVGSTLTNKITKPIGIATTAAAGLVTTLGFKRLVGVDSAKAKLKGLGYEGKDVDRIMQQVENATKTGMTTVGEGADIAAGALAAGVSEGKELEKYIKLVGDAAIGSGRPIEEMAMIFNRVQGGGKVMRNELDMIEHGMPGFTQALAKNLGYSRENMDEFFDAVSSGKVSSEDFLNTMEGFAGGMAEAYSESFAGMAKNTLAYVGIIGEALIEGLFEDGKKGLANFIEVLQSEELQNWATQTGEKIREVVQRIVEAAQDMKAKWDDLSPPMQDFIKKLTLVGSIALVALGPILQILGFIVTSVGTVIKVWNGMKMVFLALRPVFAILSGSVGLWVTVIIAAVALIITYWEPIKEFFINLWEGIKEITLLIWENITEGLSNAKENILEAWESLKEFFSNFWDGIVEVWNETIETIQEIWNGLLEFFTGLWDGIKEIFTTSGEEIGNIVQIALDKVTEIFQTVYDFLNQITGGKFGEMVDLIKSALTTAQEIVQHIWDYIKQTFENVLQFLKGLVTGDFGMMKDAMNNQMSSARDLLSNIWNTIKSNIGAKLKEILSDLISKFSEMVSNARNKTGEILTAVKDKFTQVVSAIREKLTEAVSAVGEKIGEMPGKVIEFTGQMMSAGKGLIQGLISGIKNMGKQAIDAITGVVDGVVNKAKSLLKINSPSKVFEQFGMWTGEGLAIGMDGSQRIVQKASERMANASMVNIGSVSGYVNDINRQAHSKFSSVFETEMNVGKQPIVVNIYDNKEAVRAYVNENNALDAQIRRF